MTSVLISLLIVAIICIFFLYIKWTKEKAASSSAGLDAEKKQKAALEDARILKELQLRNEERLHRSKDAQEAIDNFKSGIDDLNTN